MLAVTVFSARLPASQAPGQRAQHRVALQPPFVSAQVLMLRLRELSCLSRHRALSVVALESSHSLRRRTPAACEQL